MPKDAAVGKWTRYDTAYGCWLVAGLVYLSISIFTILPLSLEAYQVVGMLVGIPVTVAGGVALLGALVLSLILWRHAPLLRLTGLFVLLIAFIFVVKGTYYLDIAVTVAVLAVSTWWFFRGRRAAALPRPAETPESHDSPSGAV